MSDSGSPGYLHYGIIILFAIGVVGIGAHELQLRQKEQMAKSGNTTAKASAMLRTLQGSDVRASLSRKALKEPVGPDAQPSASKPSVLSDLVTALREKAASGSSKTSHITGEESDSDDLNRLAEKDIR